MRRVLDIIIVICLFFAALASLASDALNVVALYLALPIAFLLSIWKNVNVEMNEYINKYEKLLLLLIGWIFLSSLWAEYNEPASRECHRCLGCVLLSLIMASNATEKKMIPWLYLTFLVLYIGAWIYAQNHIVIEITGAYDGNSGRMNDAKLNANTMAYYTFFVTFVVFLFGDILENAFLKRICRIAFWGVLPLSFIVALVTASRQVLVIQIPLIIFLLYYRYWKEVAWVYRLLTFFILVTCCLVLSGFVVSTYEGSYLAVRNEIKLNDDSRYILFNDALKVGFENFPLGVGAGNYRMYSVRNNMSHNSFLELWVNQGFIGVILYLWLVCSFLKKNWRNYNSEKIKMSSLFFVFGLFFVVDNFFYVFYLDMWLISFFILVSTHSQTYLRKYSTSLVYECKPIQIRLLNDKDDKMF